MGYTHYWTTQRAFTDAEWALLQERARTIVHSAVKAGIQVVREYDEELAPEITDSHIALNGLGDDGHETFWLEPGSVEFEFCKTARKPYDAVVVAILHTAASINSGFTWKSDGDAKDHVEGIALARAA